jgi:CheY-like chemotaxis protein
MEQTMPVRVLLVDDDALSRDVLEVLLQAEGYEVETTESGDEALLLLQAMGSPPDVVLTDMQMPGTTGSELARRMRELCGPGTVLVAMSASAPQEEEAREFDRFLLKPFSMEMLAAAIAGGATRAADGAAAVVSLDEAVYGKLAATMGSSQLEKLYTLCLDDAERRITAMRKAAMQGDDASYRREAHAIKGGCGMVGAVKLQSIATSMETRGLCDDHVASLDEFMLAAERLRDILIARK